MSLLSNVLLCINFNESKKSRYILINEMILSSEDIKCIIYISFIQNYNYSIKELFNIIFN